MTITPRIVLNANARITPGDALANVNTSYEIGFVGENLASLLPTGASAPDLVYSREFTLGAGLTKSLNLVTMQIADIDATAPRNADGTAVAFSKIYMLIFKLLSAEDPLVAFGLRVTTDTWAQPLDFKLTDEGGVFTMFWPEGVVATGLIDLLETGGVTSDVTVQMWALGLEA